MSKILGMVAKAFPYLDGETQQEILALVREYKAKTATERVGPMPQSCVDEMVRAVPDQLVRDIVRDLRHGIGEPGGFGPRKWEKEVRKVEAAPRVELAQDHRSAQTKIFDQMVDYWAGGANDTSRLR